MFVNIGAKRLLELHLVIEAVEVIDHVCEDARPLEKVFLKVALRGVTNKCEEDERALLEEWAHFLLNIRVLSKHFVHTNLMVFKEQYVLRQLIHTLHVNINDFVHVAVWVLE